MVTLHISWTKLAATVLELFLAVGSLARAFDELLGRALNTQIPSWIRKGAASIGRAGTVALRRAGIGRVAFGMLITIVVIAFFVITSNLELFGGTVHINLGLAGSLGAIPVLTSAYAQTSTVSISAVIPALTAVVLLFLIAVTRRLCDLCALWSDRSRAR